MRELVSCPKKSLIASSIAEHNMHSGDLNSSQYEHNARLQCKVHERAPMHGLICLHVAPQPACMSRSATSCTQAPRTELREGEGTRCMYTPPPSCKQHDGSLWWLRESYCNYDTLVMCCKQAGLVIG